VKCFILAPNEGWVVDVMGQEAAHGLQRQVTATGAVPFEITADPAEADVIWLLASWCWKQLPIDLLRRKPVLSTFHHIVPWKWDEAAKDDFKALTQVTDCWSSFGGEGSNQLAAALGALELKRGHCTTSCNAPMQALIPYWEREALQRLARPQPSLEAFRKAHGLPDAASAFLVGSFQRDGEGVDPLIGKWEKGPDLLCDFLIERWKRSHDVMAVLAGYRRDYVVQRLTEAGVPFKYFESCNQETLITLYGCIDVYAVSSRFEGGPQALVECAQLRVPAICATHVGIASLVLPLASIGPSLGQAVPAVPLLPIMMRGEVPFQLAAHVLEQTVLEHARRCDARRVTT
jgi:glycosyltransferase involved in cell wall biosynthesis